MNTILYQSLFNDLDFTTLKHCIFYFDNIEVPRYNTIISWGENNQNSKYLQLVPENIQDVLMPLKKEGVINFVDLNYGPDKKLPELCNFVISEIQSTGVNRYYSASDVNEICDFIDMGANDPEKLKTVENFLPFWRLYV